MKRLLFTSFILVIVTILGANAAVLKVPTQYATIDVAIYVAAEYDTILIESGTYYGEIMLKGKKLTLASNFILDNNTSWISETILTGDSRTRVFTITDSSDVKIIGLTIAGGYLYEDAGNEGAGILCEHSKLMLSNNIISDNLTWGNGGGNHYNEGGAGLAGYHSDIHINKCRFINNNSYLIGNMDSEGQREYVTGGAIMVDSCQLKLEYSIFYHNSRGEAKCGPWGYWCGGIGAAMGIHSSNASINHCTFYENFQALAQGGGQETDAIGIKIANSDVSISNSILFRTSVDGEAQYSYCLTTDPFLDLQTWKPKYGSLCIDAADPNSPKDPNGSNADIGAMSYDGYAATRKTLYYVSNTGTDVFDESNTGSKEKPFASIAFALNLVVKGDTIVLERGAYNACNMGGHNVVLASNFIFTNNPEDIDETQIKGTMVFERGEDSTCVLKGLTFNRGSGRLIASGYEGEVYGGGAVYCKNSSPTFDYVKVRDIFWATENRYRSLWGGGMYFDHSNSVIRNCIFSNIHLEYSWESGNIGSAIYAGNNSNIRVLKSTIINNFCTSGAVYSSNSTIEINSSIIWGNTERLATEAASISGLNGGTFKVNYSCVERGISINTGVGNILSSPEFVDKMKGELNCTSPCINTGDPAYPKDADGSNTEMGAFYAQTCNPIDKTIWYVSNTGKDEYVDSGSGDKNKPFKTIEYAMYFVTENDTIILERGSYERVTFTGVNLVLASNFIFTHNYEDIIQTEIVGDADHACLYFTSGEKPNCVVKGIALKNGGVHTNLTNGIISGHIYCVNSSPTFEYLKITRSLRSLEAPNYEGGFYFSNSNSTIKNCVITHIENNKWYGAKTYGGGIYASKSALKIDHIVMADNKWGAAIQSDSSTIDLSNSIIIGNFHYDDRGVFTKKIALLGDGFNVRYSCFEDTIKGEGNMVANIVFTDNVYYQLPQNSPMINKGDPTAPLDPDGTITDMGAWWIDYSTSIPVLNSSIKIFPNPVKDEIFISSTIDFNNAKVQIIDISGNVVYMGIVSGNSVLVNKLEAGFYLLNIVINNERYIARFVKEN